MIYIKSIGYAALSFCLEPLSIPAISFSFRHPALHPRPCIPLFSFVREISFDRTVRRGGTSQIKKARKIDTENLQQKHQTWKLTRIHSMPTVSLLLWMFSSLLFLDLTPVPTVFTPLPACSPSSQPIVVWLNRTSLYF